MLMGKPKKQLNQFLGFTSVAFQMGATIWLGNILGNWVDKKYSTDYLEGLTTLIAVFVSMYLVISQVLKLSKDND